MEVEVVSTEEDLTAFFIYCLARDTKGWGDPQWGKWILFAFTAILPIFLMLNDYSTGKEPATPVNIALCFLPFLILAWIGYARLTWREKVARQVREMMKEPENAKKLGGGGRVSISPEALTLAGKEITTTMKWSAIERIVKTSDHAFFFYGENAAHILPRRAFRTAEEFKLFIKTARQYRKAACDGEKAEPSPKGLESAAPDPNTISKASMPTTDTRPAPGFANRG